MKRYSIMVVQSGGEHEYEHCQVDGGAEEVAAELRRKTLAGRKRLAAYQRVVENEPAKT